ncbi:MAG: sialidase family protein [Anaerolineae bacterium]
MEQFVVARKGTNAWMGIPTIERAANGRLWCAFYTGGPREPDPANTILLTTSTDNGATWETPWPVVEPAEGWRAYDPCLWHDPLGRLWLIYNRSAEGKGGYIQAVTCLDSTAARPALSERIRLGLGLPFAFRINKPIVISNGDWLLPVTYMRSAPEGWFGQHEHRQGVAISSDQGHSWRLHGDLQAPPWALENMVVERRDGTLWMLMRTGAGVLWQSFSSDGGHSWTAAAPSAIVNPGTRFFISRLRSGCMLLINTPDPRERRTLCAYLSEGSDAAPYSEGLLLDGRDRVSYPDAVQAPDGVIYAVHDYDRQGAGEILLNVFNENELPLPDSKAP